MIWLDLDAGYILHACLLHMQSAGTPTIPHCMVAVHTAIDLAIDICQDCQDIPAEPPPMLIHC